MKAVRLSGLGGRLIPEGSKGIEPLTLRWGPAEHPQTSTFVAAAFNCHCDTVAALDDTGRITVLHLLRNRYAVARRGGSKAVALAFSSTLPCELYVARSDGAIECLHTGTKHLLGKLLGHQHAPSSLACHSSQALPQSRDQLASAPAGYCGRGFCPCPWLR